jgi:cyclophilin family peptidyl-prolyl cis-trans isomerase
MSEERRRQQRRERQRRRRASLPPRYQASAGGELQLPGVLGWAQRHGRWWVLLGLMVMLLSVGATLIVSQTGTSGVDDQPRSGSTATVGPSPAAQTTAATATASATPAASGTPGIVRSYPAPPALAIDPAKQYEALIRTEKGDVRVQLLAADAPGYVNNFVFLARNRFFDGLTFHRVIAGFVAQGGDPRGDGTGGPGYRLPPERNTLAFDTGVLAMATSQEGVSGSQFFITLAPQPQLAEGFTVFGRVVDGMAVVRALTLRNPQAASQPPGDRILTIEISERG